MFYDCYGRPASDKDFMSADKRCAAYEVEESGNTTYIRFSSKDVGAIQKIVENGSDTTITWTIGSWTNRASLSITTDLNTAIEVVEP